MSPHVGPQARTLPVDMAISNLPAETQGIGPSRARRRSADRFVASTSSVTGPGVCSRVRTAQRNRVWATAATTERVDIGPRPGYVWVCRVETKPGSGARRSPPQLVGRQVPVTGIPTACTVYPWGGRVIGPEDFHDALF